jgi:hypothetical protein
MPVEDGQFLLQNSASDGAGRWLLGMWEVTIPADRQSADVVPLRTIDMHLNVVSFLEVSPCTNCLQVKKVIAYPTNELDVDLWISHPFPAALTKLSGFDVRGILVSEADYTFPVSGRSIAWGGSSLRMMNPDGFTPLFNPTEFPESSPEPVMFKYFAGKYSTAGDLSTTLNQFVVYDIGMGRRIFMPGTVYSRTVRLFAPAGPLHFGYVVDACWAPPHLPITDPQTDFPPEANCLEAYQVNVWIDGKLDPSVGATAPLKVEVFDHQGTDTISSVTIEAPDLFDGELSLAFYQDTGPESAMYGGNIPNDKGAGSGEYPLLVRVGDTATDPHFGQVDAWNVCQAEVGTPGGWASTWGDTDFDSACGVDVDKFGNVYVTGCFRGTIDFDNGPGKDEHVGNTGKDDAFLVKYDPDGNFLWAQTWGGDSYDFGQDVGVDNLGNAFVVGSYGGIVDFDPGPGTDNHQAVYGLEVFLCKYDPDGNFVWARTWAADANGFSNGLYIIKDCALDVDTTGHSYVTGSFFNTVDFDPGDGVEEHSSNGQNDAFLSKFDTNGNLIWVKTWGGDDLGANPGDRGYGVSAESAGFVWVTGSFRTTVDFNPGAGVENRTSNGDNDVFLMKFSPIGGFLWVSTWGGASYDLGLEVDADDDANAFVTGSFSGDVDFDPGPNYDTHTSKGVIDPFLSKLDTDGNFLWARTWGGVDTINLVEWEWAEGVEVDLSGNAYVTGLFNGASGLVDLDPGPGVDNHSAIGLYYDAFLSKFDPAGNYVWGRTWGGTYEVSDNYESGHDVATNDAGDAIVAGIFLGTCDFDPGTGTDYHSSAGYTDSFVVKFLSGGGW